jgi:hypothetical protein
MTTLEEKSPYIKEHDNKTICFADTLTQAKNALERKEIKDEDKDKLDGAHLMLFGVESWKKKEMGELKNALSAGTNTFERLEIFGCEMSADDQFAFGQLLDPEHLSNIKQFDLDNTPLEANGAVEIFKKIAEVPSIEILNLQGSIAGKAPVMAAIADNLVEDANIYKSLWKLDLKINELKEDGAAHVARIVSRIQQTSRDNEACEIDLFYNDIGAAGAGHIAGALKLPNCVVTHLDLCCNQIGDEGAMHIAGMLRTNRTLKVLKLALNNIGTDGGIAIFKALAPRSHDANQVKNTVLEVLDISANVMKEEKAKEDTGADNAVIEERSKLDAELKQYVDEEENPLEGKEADVQRIRDQMDALVFSYNEVMPLVEAISAVCTASHLLEFDFTGIELGNECWNSLGLQLSTTTNKSLQKRGVPMKIRFSIVDCMNEDNLKTLEKYIWGDKNDQSSPYHTHAHIDWRRRDDDANNA